MNHFNRIILYCRPGFEKECAQEITDKAQQLGHYGFAKTKAFSGYVEFECYEKESALYLIKAISFNQLIFARQFFVTGSVITIESKEDRIHSILAQMPAKFPLCSFLQVETPDTNEAKSLSAFCRKFKVPLRQALRQHQFLTRIENNKKPTCHLFWIDDLHCFLGYSLPENQSVFEMGIPRLRFPANAPSRSTLKLEEAFHVFIPYEEWEERLRGGLKAVDLGASPGGWTYQLVTRSFFVFAVDNGPMNQELLDSGQVKHFKEDGFKFLPSKKNITWLVCDMVESPIKVTELMIKWLVEGYCREAIFNLKLPMKKRYEEVKKCLDLLDEQLKAHHINFKLQAKQLYHDREEVTVHVQNIWASFSEKAD